ncbi:HK97 family phage prohead protease [Actinomyces urogenitalis]|uniref:HK97 family phage prohead protease n=1 Tax=Actinomyces urogenitalis TaxID=103621 RepID=UPI00242D6B56|nr:HK97 family phage prohead protease [Actinomyces urogenitalis]MCI7456985.1 HK97 family phage prohead protease [Actinomyces urogenitalis]
MTGLFLTLTAADPIAHPTERTITGTAAIYDTPGTTSAGPTIIAAGALVLPDDLHRVKLLIEHDRNAAVGYATSATDHGDHLAMTFYLPPGDLADQALASVAAGLRDGLSVGAYAAPGGYTTAHTPNGDVITLTRADLREVSLCTIPAFDQARATTHHQENPMKTRKPTDTPDDTDETTPDTTDETTDETTPDTTDDTPDETDDDMDTDDKHRKRVNASQPTPTPAPALAPRTGRAPASMTAAAHRVMDTLRSGGSALEVRAALSDIVPAMDKGQAFYRPQWLGELWEARRVDRPLIDSITRRPLPSTGMKVYGFQWDKRPTVDDYSGNKTDIPTSTATTKPLEADVKRMAAGWDIDRLFIDRGEPGLIEAIWTSAVEDLAVKTEAKALTEIRTKATTLPAASNLPAALVNLGVKASTIGANIDFVAFAPDVWAGLAALTHDDIPWWMGGSDTLNLSSATGGVGGLRLFVNTSLPAGEIIAGDKRAVTWFEDTPPIRVDAIDLPRGGVDLGLFAYYAVMTNDPKALFKTSIAAAGTGA